MDVLHFASSDGKIVIQASTAANIQGLWRRFVARVGGEEAGRSYCDYKSSLPGRLEIASPDHNFSLTSLSDDDGKLWSEEPPVFYETAKYNVSIRISGIDAEPHIAHAVKEITDAFSAIKLTDHEWMLTGTLDLVNEPGIFELAYRYKPIGQYERSETFSFRVVSPKLDAKNDFIHILRTVNEEYNDIVYQYLTKTFQSLTIGGKTDNDIVWLSIFQSIIDNYLKAVRFIVNRPHLRERTDVRYSHADRIKRWTPQMARQYAESERRGTLERDYFRHEITETTHNTRENRFVKYTVDRISRRLEGIVSRIRQKAAAKEYDITPEAIQDLESKQKELRKLANSSLLRGLRGEPLRQESMVLQKRTGYAAVYRYWILLQKGIELLEGQNNIGVRPIWELYELWCFLKMRKMIAKILGLDFNDQSQIEDRPTPMLEPFNDSIAEHVVLYHYPGQEVELHYQQTFSRKTSEILTATTDNRPDIVLTIKKPNGMELTYLYDAKYRVLDDDALSKEDAEEDREMSLHADYPPSDAINQMHRYRDAIYYKSHPDTRWFSAKEIIGGYILFPGRGSIDAIKNRYYYRSIETVNIGAFPLLPDSGDPDNEGSLLREHLERILVTEDAYGQIKDSIPQRGLVYSQTEADTNELVLVGSYKNDAHLQAIIANKLYYVRTGNQAGSIQLVSGFDHTKYLLLHNYDSTERKLLMLTGKGPKFFTAEALESMGFARPSGDFYLGFSLRFVHPLDIPGFDLDHAALIPGKLGQRPYFTTLKELNNPSK